MKEFNDAFDFAKKESEKKKQKQLSKARTEKINLVDNMNNLFNAITNQ